MRDVDGLEPSRQGHEGGLKNQRRDPVPTGATVGWAL